ncbi:MAG: LCP family protein, partial [Mycetocola sp.]
MRLPFAFETPPASKPWRSVVTVVVGLLVVAGVVSAMIVVGTSAVLGAYTARLSATFDNAKKIEVEEVFPAEATRPDVPANASQNILLMGSDTRGSLSRNIGDVSGTRSDTIMVVHISAARDTVHVMSFLRDSWVDIPGLGTAKLNAALADGGVPLAVQTIEGLIGARIDRVAIVDFAGFKGLTNALGGVEVDNPVAFEATHMKGKTFAQGLNTLTGEEALAFVRERYAFPDGDYQRVRNQQIFIKAVLREILSTETLTNPLRLDHLVSTLAPFLTLDAGFTSSYAAGMALQLHNIRMDDVTFFTAPTLGTGTEGDQSVVYVD